MKKLQLMDKYPVHVIEIKKSEIALESVDAIIEYFKELIEKHPVAKYIAVFDHYEHTTSLEGSSLGEGIKDAKNIIFCFGKQLPSPKILAVRPRSIGVCELEESFEIVFLEVPNEQLQETVTEWVKGITK